MLINKLKIHRLPSTRFFLRIFARIDPLQTSDNNTISHILIPKIISKLHLFSYFLFCVLFTSCVSATGGIASSNLPVSGKNYKVIGPVEGEESRWIIDMGLIGLPLGPPPMIELEKKLMEENKADALIHIRWSYESMVFFFFVVKQSLILKADAIQFEKPKKKNRRRR